MQYSSAEIGGMLSTLMSGTLLRWRRLSSMLQCIGRVHGSWCLIVAEMKAAPATFSCTVDIEVKLRAFVPDLSPQSVAVAVRMLDRTQQYSQYSPYWQVRPKVGVSRSPCLWWQHAGNAAARECRLISRRQVGIPASEFQD